jgi:hypothetical protein
MIFKLRQKLETLDENNNKIETISEQSYEADLIGGVFKVFSRIDDELVCVQSQPWCIDDDNNRSEWLNIEQGVQWYKKINQHIGDE